MGNKKRYYKGNRERKDKRASSVNLMDNRIIFLNGEITDISFKEIIEQLLKLDMSNDKKDITLFTNSGGGNVPATLAIYDTMNYIKSDIKTIGIGKCFSTALLILLNGNKGKRFMTKNAEVMIHEVSSGSFDKVSEMKEDLNHSIIVNDKVLKIIANKTNRTLKQIRTAIKNKDNWMNSIQALKFGFVDKVL